MDFLAAIRRLVSRPSAARLILAATIGANVLLFLVWARFYGAVRPYETDAYYYYAYLPTLLLDGDLDFENNYQAPQRYNPTAFRPDIWEWRRTPTGRLGNKYGIGFFLLSAPFFLLGHGVAWLGRALGASWPLDGYSPPYTLAVALGQVALAGAAIVCCFSVAVRFVSATAAALGCAGAWLGTLLLIYTSHSPFMSHASAFFTVSCFALCAVRMPTSDSLWLWGASGLVAGVMALVRYQNAAFALLALPAVVGVLRRGNGWRRPTAKVGLLALGFAIIVLAQLVVWKRLYGSWLIYTYKGEHFRWEEPNVGRLFFDFKRGLPGRNPMVLVGLAGALLLLFSRGGRTRHCNVTCVPLSPTKPSGPVFAPFSRAACGAGNAGQARRLNGRIPASHPLARLGGRVARDAHSSPDGPPPVRGGSGRAFVVTAVLCIAIQVYVNASWYAPMTRVFSDYAFVFALGLGYLFQHRWRAVALASGALSLLIVVWNIARIISWPRTGHML